MIVKNAPQDTLEKLEVASLDCDTQIKIFCRELITGVSKLMRTVKLDS